MEAKNMFFSLVDADISSKKETNVTYDDLLEQVNSKAEICHKMKWIYIVIYTLLKY